MFHKLSQNRILKKNYLIILLCILEEFACIKRAYVFVTKYITLKITRLKKAYFL